MITIEFSDVDRIAVRQSLLLRMAQLRRAIDREIDASIQRIRREQLAHIKGFVDRLS